MRRVCDAACTEAVTQRRRLVALRQTRRCIAAVYTRNTTGSLKPAVTIRANYLDTTNVFIDHKAHGIPFHISEPDAVDRVCRHHGASVAVHSVERYLMPFWLLHTAASGTFRADILQRNPTMITSPDNLVWVQGPNYSFGYPFGEYMPMNQICAAYVEPMRLIEDCLCGSHISAMLLSRFELKQVLERMPAPPRLIPFTMSTTTALSVAAKRINRSVILTRIDLELRKFHGTFLRSNVMLTSLAVQAMNIRPVFLPLIKLTVSTSSSPTPVPAYVCGATGNVVGPVLHVPPRRRLVMMAGSALSAVILLAPLVDPGVATAAALAAAVLTPVTVRYLHRVRFLRGQAKLLRELQSTSLHNLAADTTTGFRWCVEDEERDEYEYREELRRQARHKAAFEQRVKDEAARDRARAEGRYFDPKRRRRTDLLNVDPLGYYALLGLKGQETSATAEDIARAFRQAVRLHHPDVSPDTARDGGEASKQQMQKIIAAYKVLHNPQRKREYDGGEITKEDA